MPPGFGPHGGEIWVADEDDNAVHAVRNYPARLTPFFQISSLTLTRKAFTLSRTPPCTFCSGSAFFVAEQQMFQQIWRISAERLHRVGWQRYRYE